MAIELGEHRHVIEVDKEVGCREVEDFLGYLLLHTSTHQEISPQLKEAIKLCILESKKDESFWNVFDM